MIDVSAPTATAILQHTPEPWFVFGNGHCVGGPCMTNPDADTGGIAMCGMRVRSALEAAANTARIVACVNAMENIADPASYRRDSDKLAAFKKYVHDRLDTAGVPVDPDSPHKAEGCRIGGRLDVLFAEVAALRLDAGRWRALFRPGGRVRVLGTSFRPDEPYYHIGLELWSHYPADKHDQYADGRVTVTRYADGVAAIDGAATVDPWPTVEQSPPPHNVQLRIWRHEMASDTVTDGELHATTDGDGDWMIGPELILRPIHPLDRWQRVTPPAGITLPTNP